MSALLKQAIEHWAYVAPMVKKPTNDQEYQVLVQALDDLLDYVGEDDSHPLHGLIKLMADGIEAYDADTYPAEPVPPRDMLALLMQQHGLRQSDLPEVGSQGVVSEILSGRRDLNLRQMIALAERFQVSLSTFVPDISRDTVKPSD